MAALVEYAPAFGEPIEIVQVLTIGSADYVAPGMEKYIREGLIAPTGKEKRLWSGVTHAGIGPEP